MNSLLNVGISNLADHCEAVLAMHGFASTRSDGLWHNDHRLLIPYPQMIALDDSISEEASYAGVESLLSGRPDSTVTGVNDSFSRLELGRFGMRKLYSSPWSVRQPGPLSASAAVELEIEAVESTEQLQEFDRACSAGFADPNAIRVYLDALLQDGRYRIHVGRSAGQVVTGGMAFENGDSAGIYSLFTLPQARNRGYAEAIVRSLVAPLTHLPIVTNPSDMSDGLFSSLGFGSAGKRTVWLKTPKS